MDREEIAKKSVENLKRYIKEDLIYQENKPESDFDQFCINHCKDIDNVLDYVSELETSVYGANNVIYKLTDLLRDSVSKDTIREEIQKIEEKMGQENNEKVLIWLHKQRKILKVLLKEERIWW